MAIHRKSQKAPQAKGRTRKKPGSGGSGDFYHIEVREGDSFEAFRTQDVGDEGHLQRVAGKRKSGSWATVKWLVSKEDAHVEDGRLVPDTKDARDLLKKLGSKPVHLSGDRFEARPRRNASRPTTAQTRARRQNIRKAQAARQAQ